MESLEDKELLHRVAHDVRMCVCLSVLFSDNPLIGLHTVVISVVIHNSKFYRKSLSGDWSTLCALLNLKNSKERSSNTIVFCIP
jgi:hypothetical protein